MAGTVGLGIRLEKEKSQKWPTAFWAAVDDEELVAHAVARAPKTYDEADALRHLGEAITAAVRESHATKVFVWTIENNARANNDMRPRLRLEGAVCVAAAGAGASVALGAWSEVVALTKVPRDSKASYAGAREVCGVERGEADPYALLAAVGARGTGRGSHH